MGDPSRPKEVKKKRQKDDHTSSGKKKKGVNKGGAKNPGIRSPH